MERDNNVYYFWGAEAYLMDQRIKDIVERVREENGEEPELVMVDGDDTSALELGETLQFSALFALSRVVVIKNPAWLGKNTRKAKKAEEIVKVIQDYLAQNQSWQTLVLCSVEYNASNPVSKMLAKQAQIIEVKPLSSKALGDWIKDAFGRRGLQAEAAAINLLANSGQDMYYLENLIEKMALMVNAGIVRVKDLEMELDTRQEIKVFKLTDALLGRNLAASLEAFAQLQEQGQPYLLMLYMISRQLLSLSKVKFYQEAGYSINQIAEVTAQKDFVVRKMMEKSARFSSDDIRTLFKKLLDIDVSFKSESKDQRMLMETLLVDFCNTR